MSTFLDLLGDNESVAGRFVTSLVVVLVAAALAFVLARALARRAGDPYGRYYARKVSRYAVAVLTVIVLAVVWRAFAGRLAVVLGLATAGIAFAMQEAIGALAGWFNIVAGRIFRVGDRIQMGGVRGDVIDITPLRTKVLEIGSGTEDRATWVRGRQFTGRIVTISNKATFTEPVFNYSAMFDFIWEELMIPVAHDADWQQAERILEEEARRVSAGEGARRAIDTMARSYPVPRAEVEPRVFVRATDDFLELSARFVVPVRTARSVMNDLTRRVVERLAAAGIDIASTTQEVIVRPAAHFPPDGPEPTR